ncbi:hypothetical protein EDC01DRAFT_732755 [Geopyxis carbonaria]|nr:hypothetical protein EDC01DRAFT_732755 [Geopyxis carbonaria]
MTTPATSSPRHLTLRAAREAAHPSPPTPPPSPGNADLSDLLPNHQRLHSRFIPSLPAGPEYTINVSQRVRDTAGAEPLTLSAEKKFTVAAPQFRLPAGSIHSVYPPPGYTETARVLPHVVLSDAFLPWERRAGATGVPWLGLISFSGAELRLSAEELAALAPNSAQTGTFATNIPLRQAWAAHGAVAEGPDPEERVDVVWVPGALFGQVFNHGTAGLAPLAHVRRVNMAGMAGGDGGGTASFGVVVGARAGPLVAGPVVVHLVSLEGVGRETGAGERIAMVSLHSWTYNVPPAGTREVQDVFEDLGRTLGVLAPDGAVEPRMKDGYSLLKYRTHTGEQTVGFMRGPCTPTLVGALPISRCSNSGIELQIVDRSVGIVDITYSAAWQLGRTMAIADQAYTTALVRLRAAIGATALEETKRRVLEERDAWTSLKNLLEGLTTTVAMLGAVGGESAVPAPADEEVPEFTAGDQSKRWYRGKVDDKDLADLAFGSKEIGEIYLEEATKAALGLSLSSDGPNLVYDETNSPVSTDWMVVLGWLLDRLYLAGIPAHYLITDPSHLPPERLRFFHIDQNWTDALLDGALSIANHLGNDQDRVAIKAALNRYLTTANNGAFAPQVPRYGFFLRSDIVSMFPDMKVTTVPGPESGRAPLLRHEIIGEGVMMGLLDRRPGSDSLQELQFTQPAHQQRYAVGDKLTADELKIVYRRQFTVTESERQLVDTLPRSEHCGPSDTRKPDDKGREPVFTWGTAPGQSDLRLVRAPAYAAAVHAQLTEHMGGQLFSGETASSALLAGQLSDAIFRLVVRVDENTPALGPPDGGYRPRVLRRMRPSEVLRLLPHPPTPPETPEVLTPPPVIKPPVPRIPLPPPPPFVRAPVDPKLRDATGPHIPPIPLDTTPAAPRLPVDDDDGGPVKLPTVTCGGYAQGYTYARMGARQNLIFSINIASTSSSTLTLRSVSIWIPFGPGSRATDVVQNMHMLTAYDGPGATMVSNLRFNAQVRNELDGRGRECCVIRAIPRSRTGGVTVRKGMEVSVRLAGARVTVNERRPGAVGTLTLGARWEAVYKEFGGKVVDGEFAVVMKMDGAVA